MNNTNNNSNNKMAKKIIGFTEATGNLCDIPGSKVASLTDPIGNTRIIIESKANGNTEATRNSNNKIGKKSGGFAEATGSLNNGKVGKFYDWLIAGLVLTFPERFYEWEQMLMRSNKGKKVKSEESIDIAIQLMKDLDNWSSIKETAAQFKKCNLSSSDKETVLNIVLSFSKRGPEFIEGSGLVKMTPKLKEKILEIKKTNEILKGNMQNQSSTKIRKR